MKKAIRLIALLLLLCMLPLGLLACGGEDDPDDTTKSNVDLSKVDPKWEGVDFSDVTLYIAMNKDVNQSVKDAGAGNALGYLKGPDDKGMLSRSDYKAAYERHELVCNVLGLKQGKNLVYTDIAWNGGPDETLVVIQDFNAANMTNTPNVIIHQNYGIVRGGILGEFYNALDKEEENYFDFSTSGWYLDMMKENTLDDEKIYMLMGDYFIDQFRFAYGVLVNTAMIEDIMKYDGGMEGLYQMVEDGEWTYDEMMNIASLGYKSADTGSELVMGAIGELSWTGRTFFASSGLDVFTKNPTTGAREYVADIGPIHDWMDRMITMQNQDYFEHNWTGATALNTNRETAIKTFINGGAVFAMDQHVLSFEGANIQNMTDPASILPTPKYVPQNGVNDFNTNYKALTSDHAGSGGILISSDPTQFTAASAFIQLMTEESEEFFVQYYDVGLKHRENAAGLGHIAMLDYIHNGVCSPMSFLYDNYCAKSCGDASVQTYSAMIQEMINLKTNTYASAWNSMITVRTNRWAVINANFGTSNAAGAK